MTVADTQSAKTGFTMFGQVALALPHALAWKVGWSEEIGEEYARQRIRHTHHPSKGPRPTWRKRLGVHMPTLQETSQSSQGWLKEKARRTHTNAAVNLRGQSDEPATLPNLIHPIWQTDNTQTPSTDKTRKCSIMVHGRRNI